MVINESPLRILLVDDDPHACNVFRLILDHHQLSLAMVHDVESAIQYLEQETPDVIVFDLFLPDSDGYQGLKRIRNAKLADGCRIIATTAYHTSDTSHEVMERGFDGFIAKPFQTDELVDYLRNIADDKSG